MYVNAYFKLLRESQYVVFDMDQGNLLIIFLWTILKFADWEFEYKLAIRFVYLAKLVFFVE